MRGVGGEEEEEVEQEQYGMQEEIKANQIIKLVN